MTVTSRTNPNYTVRFLSKAVRKGFGRVYEADFKGDLTRDLTSCTFSLDHFDDYPFLVKATENAEFTEIR